LRFTQRYVIMKKNTLRKLIMMVSVMTLVIANLLSLGDVEAVAADDITISFNYYRKDGDFSGVSFKFSVVDEEGNMDESTIEDIKVNGSVASASIKAPANAEVGVSVMKDGTALEKTRVSYTAEDKDVELYLVEGASAATTEASEEFTSAASASSSSEETSASEETTVASDSTEESDSADTATVTTTKDKKGHEVKKSDMEVSMASVVIFDVILIVVIMLIGYLKYGTAKNK